MTLADLSVHFLRPWWWLALTPLPLALWMLARSGGGRAALARLADAALLPHLVRDGGAQRRFAWGLLTLAWLLATAALAGPSWQRVETPLYVNGAARVVALSLSHDMLAQDLAPDRLTRARFAVRDLLDAAGDARTALVAYAGAAFTVAPLTSDKHTVLNLLRALQPDVMPVAGNDAAAGISRSAQLLHDAQVRGGEIILVGDRAGAAAVAAARKAHANGIRVDVLGIGTAQGAPVPQAGGGFASAGGGTLLARRDDASLRAVAKAGGGAYAILPADGGATPTFAAPVAMSGHASQDERARVWRDGGIWLLPVLVILAALAFRRGWLVVLALVVLPVAMPTAHAATPSSWFANRDQRAWQALQHGDPQQARTLARSPGLRGSAAYRAGDYAEAAKAFAQGHDARSRYNLGNALAKQGEYRQAITAYQQALQIDPHMADARVNLEAVEEWLKQQSTKQTSQGQRRDNSPNQHGQSNKPGQSGKGDAKPRGRDGNPQSGSAAASSSPPSSAGQGGTQAQAGAMKTSPQSGGTQQRQDEARSGKPDAPSPEQSARAAAGLQRELQQAGHARGNPDHDAQQAFALGQHEPKPDGKLNAQQRALLRSVPDDPGGLLRRKFQLEWERRTGQPQGGGS